MTVLGFNDPYHDSSFCLLGPDGYAFYELERFTRQKLERLNPLLGFLDLMGADALEGCTGIGVVEGDFLTPLIRRIAMARAASSDPGRVADGLLRTLWAQHTMTVPDAPGRLLPLLSIEPFRDGVHRFVRHAMQPSVRLAVLGHHLCHAANAFLSSAHERALCITLDGGGFDVLDTDPFGERSVVYGGTFRAAGGTIEPVAWRTDLAIGAAWSRLTQSVFGLQFGEEGTVMAMAAYGDPARFAARLDPPWIWFPTPSLAEPEAAASYASQIAQLRMALRTEQDRFDLAAALQQQTESKVYAHIAEQLEPDDRVLCLAGGLFLNCQITGKLQSWFPQLEHVTLPPAPYDGGLSIGAAQYVHHVLDGAPRMPEIAPFASGPVYDRATILRACAAAGMTPQPAGVADVAALLAAGQIGGLFAGPAESGRRALGHRSILADPRTMRSRERINTDIKRRATFRPLAPMVLQSQVGAWFVCPAGFTSPYMAHALHVRPEQTDRIPAVVHRDGTARVQTVDPALTPGLHALLTAWQAVSGMPVLLNTSFNENEPIVQTPDQALACFARTGLDFLYFGDESLLVKR